MSKTLARPEIRVLKDADEWRRAAAGEIVRAGKEAAGRKGRFTVALAGGSTPRPAYEMMATHPTFRQLMPWKRTHFFWSDERYVPSNSPDSNYRMAHEAVLSPAEVPEKNIHRAPTELGDPAAVAAQYEKDLRTFFRSGAGKAPRFDLILLGLGPDGHTASLFPGADAVNETERLVVAVSASKPPADRITFTLPLINHAASVVFLVTGEEKAERVLDILSGGKRSKDVPAGLVQPESGRLTWILDSGAAKLL